jgi:hypothetical protein
MSKFVSFVGMVTTLLMAYVCNLLIEGIRLKALATFNLAPYMWLAGIANLFLAILLLLLTWHVVFRADRSIFVSSVFVLFGLALTFASALEMSVASTTAFSPTSYVSYAAAFVTIIGIAAFVLPRRPSN